MNSKILVLIVIISVAIQSCGSLGLYSADKGEVLASVGDKELYDKDLEHIFTGELTAADSAALLDKYIDNWVRNQIKIAAAEAALSQSQEQIEELVNQYRTSLITYRYEDDFVARKLDTTITRSQIEEYYKANRDNFRLGGPVVKAVVVRLPSKLRLGRKFEDMFKSDTPKIFEEFKEICQKNNYRFDDYSEGWSDFSTVISHLPFTNSNFDEFLKSKKYYEVEDDQYKYMLRIMSYLPTGDYSPLERETANIRKILFNIRRGELISKLEDSLMNVAIKNEKVHINTRK